MPDVDVATNFFLVLTVVADAIVALALLCAVAALVSRSARASVVSWARAVAPQAVMFAWVVATVTTLGSLYYSEHAGFVPCELCWYQRILMYPLVIVLGVAALRRDRAAWMTGGVFVVLGAPLSLYHWLVERVPAFEESSSCSAITPCNTPWFEKWGFVTLAWMAMSAFLLIGVLLVCTLLGARDRTDETSTPTVRALEEV
jgi:disulfide bond formation protein DsbB